MNSLKMWVSVFVILGTWSACLAYPSISLDLGDNYRNISKSVTSATKGSPWPMPQSIKVSLDVYTLVGESEFTFTPTKVQCDTLNSAFDRYYAIIFFGKPHVAMKKQQSRHPREKLSASVLSGLQVQIQEPCPSFPDLDSDESYTLDITTPSAILTANSIWGALRGLETFSQIIYESADGTLVVNKTSIVDKPRFKHRGYMVDSSRHYLSLSSIFDTLDAMAYNKFNVFHWHIVDDQAFPYESAAFPIISEKNAFDHHHVYTRENIKQVIEYARLRGIRVVPEFDTPGHTQSWGAIADLLTPCYDKGKPTGLYGPINPALNSTYDFLKTFFTEVVDLFPDKYVHMGGDEVSFSCWESNPNITAFMNAHQFGSNYSKLEEYYEQKLLDIMAGLNAGYMVWQEVIDNKVQVSPDTVVHVWKGNWQIEASKVTLQGFRTLISSPYYLNRVSNPYSQEWRTLYLVDPQNITGTDAQKKLVIGGEVCMWGEYVDSTNLIQRTWPRASSVGERLWSAKDVTDVEAAQPRLLEQRCRMVRRGLQAEPVTGPGFCKYEYDD